MRETLGTQSPMPSPLLAQDVCDALEEAVRLGTPLDLRLGVVPPDFFAPNGTWVLRLQAGGAGIRASAKGLEQVPVPVSGGAELAPDEDADGFRAFAHLPGGDPADIIMSVEDALGWDLPSGEAGLQDMVEGPGQEVSSEEYIPEELEDYGPPEADPFVGFGVDLVEEARAGRLEPPLHRAEEIAALATALCKREKKAVMIVGEAGTGKTAIVEGLALKIAAGEVPSPLQEVRIISVNIPMLAAGRSHLNEFEGHLKALIDLARDNRDVILFFDEAHTLLAQGSNGSQLIKADLGRGLIRAIGATTAREYREIEKDAALARRFQVLPINELDPDHAADVALARSYSLSEHHGVEISEDLVRYGVRRAKWGAPHRVNPDAAIDLIDESAAIAGVAGDPVLDIHHIHRALSRWLGLSADRLGLVRPSREYFQNLRIALLDRVPGQPRAIGELIKVLERRSQIPPLEERRGVRSSFLIVEGGDTGMGDLVEVMADLLYDRNHLVTIDGSSITEEHHLATLWGSPPGYVGHGQGGRLTNAIRDKRHGVLWIQNLERAHPLLVGAVLPPLIGQGVVPDMNTGEKLDASQFILVLTATLGGDVPSPGFSVHPAEASKAELLAQVQRLIPRDVRQGLDSVVPLEPISRAAARLMLDRHAEALRARLEARTPSVRLIVDEAVFERLLDSASTRGGAWGAKRLEEAFARQIEEPLGHVLAERSQEAGTISVYLNEEGERRLRFIPPDLGTAVQPGSEPGESPQAQGA